MQDALEVDSFAQSEEAFAAEALFEAYRTGTAEDVQKCISKRPIFFDLDNSVSFSTLPFRKMTVGCSCIQTQSDDMGRI